MPCLALVPAAAAIAACPLVVLVIAWLIKAERYDHVWRFAGVVAVFVPLAGLLDPHAGFGYDWVNHEWMIGYFGEYFREHQRITGTFNSSRAIGMPQPVFYAFLVYPLMGMLASAVGAALALRMTLVAAAVAQYACVWIAGRAATTHRVLPALLAFGSVGSTYALTDLYNRGAITEYLAVSFLTSAVCLAMFALLRGRAFPLWLAGLCLVLAIGCHPPTALLGSLFSGLLGLAVFASGHRLEKRMLWALLAAGALAVVVAAPWIYATLQFRSQLGVVGAFRSLDLLDRRTDSLLGRFLPFPSASLWPAGTDDLPFVEAPIDGVLLLVLGWNVVLLAVARGSARAAMRKLPPALPVALAGFVWFAVAAIVSVSRQAANLASPLAPYVQFCYRFVAHANLGLLVAVLATCSLATAAGLYVNARRGTAIVIAAGLLVVLTAVMVKLGHAAVVLQPQRDPQYSFRGDRTALVTKPRADAASDYATTRMWPQLAPWTSRDARHVDFSPGTAHHTFGDVPPVTIDSPHDEWLVTNVVAFPWNRLTVDGRAPESMLIDRWRWAVKVGPGRHEIAWRWSPDFAWVILTTASRVTFGAAILLTFIVAWWRKPELA
ncbi:MAG TPA: hypothetical protein VHE61_22905 [Opitutaceae bacterium]|nr:hypothetical protein [Opitutaceae bacterium]